MKKSEQEEEPAPQEKPSGPELLDLNPTRATLLLQPMNMPGTADGTTSNKHSRNALPMEEYMRLTTRCRMIDRPLGSSSSQPRILTRRARNDFLLAEEHRRQVLLMRDQKEEEDTCRKFLLSHSREINKQHVIDAAPSG